MTDELRSILTGTLGLSIPAVVSAWLAIRRSVRLSAGPELNRVRQVAAIAILLQAGHFGEEWYTGFYRRFPEMLGFVPWPSTFFVAFNLAWLMTWSVSAAGLSNHPRLFSFPIWFLGIASVVNGIAHPALASASGGYFPGLWTSPLVAVAGVLLLRALGRATVRAAVYRGIS